MIMVDVSGKGVPGLVVMAMLKVMVRDLIYQRLSPKEVVRKLNISLAENLKPKMFVTLFIAYLNLDTSELTYSNAGHNPLMVYSSRARKCTLHKLDGSPLGVFPDEMFSSLLSEYRLTIEPGDLAFQYTDGLSESADIDDKQFGFDTIQQACARFAEHGAMACVQQMIVSEEAFRRGAPQQDDITLLALSCSKTPSDGDATAVSGPGVLAGNLSTLVHSIDFDKSTVLLDVVGPISDTQVGVLKHVTRLCHDNHFENLVLRCKPSLLEDARGLLRDIPASDPLVTVTELHREKQQDDALYRLPAGGADRTTTVEYAIRLSDFQSAMDRINSVLLILGSSIPLDEKCLTHLEFCVHELVANSVEHGVFTTHTPAIEIAFVVRRDTVDVLYRDNAEPFRPSSRLEVDIPGEIRDGKKRGLGIYLIHQLTEELKHEREDEWNNTTFRIKRELELQEA
jgi:anti-sigma regulatory factor (Ser/Thr protein kinase)